MAKKPYFGDKNRNILETHFFYKNRASSLFYIHWRLTSCKKSEKSNGGKYENFLLLLLAALAAAITKKFATKYKWSCLWSILVDVRFDWNERKIRLSNLDKVKILTMVIKQLEKKGEIFLVLHLPKLDAFRMIQFLKYEKNYQIFISYHLSFYVRSTDVRTGKSIYKLPLVLWLIRVESRNIFLATSEIFCHPMPREIGEI